MVVGSSTSGTTVADTESTGESTGEPPSFECPPLEGESQCDVAEQDCPDGFKCVPWTPDEGSLKLEAQSYVCAAVTDDPVALYGECTRDPGSCTDDCGDGAFCSSLLADSPVCVEICDSDYECGEGQQCRTCATCSVSWCMPNCDPLEPECPEGFGSCVFNQSWDDAGFTCEGPEPGTAMPGDPCMGFECVEGSMCMAGEMYGPGCDSGGCCIEFCDLNDPTATCPEAEHECIPFLNPGVAEPGQEHIGICALPEFHPCNTPGACPPDGVDDTYPWCSLENENFCDRGNFGFGNGAECISGCFCIEHCLEDADCPTPPTGTAPATCILDGATGENNRCSLDCSGGQECPLGMECRAEWDDVCMWVSPKDC
ncbi:MAG: hypothetical protein AAF799_05295 [Myxococcota bacterium]